MALISLGLEQPSQLNKQEKRSNPLDNPRIPLGAAANLLFLGGGHETDGAELVDISSSLRLSTVYTCCKILAESVSSLPLQLFKKTDTGKTLEEAHPLSWLLGSEPNPEMDYVSWIESQMSNLCLAGNSYNYLQRDSDGNVIGIWPLNPRDTHPFRLPNRQLVFKTTDGGVSRILQADQVMHIKLYSYEGLLGFSPIMQNKRLIGAQIASERYGSRLFANNATPSGIITTVKEVKAEHKQLMRQAWEEQQTGSNQHRVAILDQDAKFEKISINPDEAQWIESRGYTRADIGAIFGIDSHRLGSEERQTDSNVAAMNLQFYKATLLPYLIKFESAIARSILPRSPGRASEYEAKFNSSTMLRGDDTATAAWAQSGIANGYLSPADVRRGMGLNEGPKSLEIYRVPINFQSADDLLLPKSAPATPTPTPTTEQDGNNE